MSSDIAVGVHSLGKFYKRRSTQPRPTTVPEAIAAALRRRRTRAEGFWALRDINLEVAEGSLVGIVGRNGAGKSTLLKLLSRITQPTTGEIRLRGSVASLLEVGSGFHPELTGRENIFLNGSVLGMRRAEIRRQFDEIVDFAGIEEFLETPVKRYSSGMYVRLAFAVAAHLTPRILIVDEVLAVGDAEFQRKCLGRMDAVARSEGRTVLFVSHNFAAVSGLCERAILLDQGRVVADGPTGDILQTYSATLAASGYEPTDKTGWYDLADRVEGYGAAPVDVLQAIQTCDAEGRPADTFDVGAPIIVDVRVDNLDRLHDPAIGLGIESDFDQRVLAISSRMKPTEMARTPGARVIRFQLAGLPFPPGRYHVGLAVQDGNNERWIESVPRAAPITVVDGDFYGSGWKIQGTPGSVCVDFTWQERATDSGPKGVGIP